MVVPVARQRLVGLARPRRAERRPAAPLRRDGGDPAGDAAAVPAGAARVLVVRPPEPTAVEDALALRLARARAPSRNPDAARPAGARSRAAGGAARPAAHVLTVPCPACGEPVGLDWQICAWCAAELPWSADAAAARSGSRAGRDPDRPGRAAARAGDGGARAGRRAGPTRTPGRRAAAARRHRGTTKNAARPGRGPDRAA